MAGKGFRLRWQPTTVGGTVAESMTAWSQIVNGSAVLTNVFLRASKNIQFDFTITSPTGNVIYRRRNNVQELNEPSSLLMRGLYILTIEKASLDIDTYEGEFMFRLLKDK